MNCFIKDIQVVKKSKAFNPDSQSHRSVQLNVVKKKNEKGRIVVSVVGEGLDGKKRWSNFIWEGEATTSTALGKWIRDEFQERLLELKGNVHTLKEGQEYYDIDVDQGIYGLYYDMLKGKVVFDERIGMKHIENILSMIGVKLEKVMINGKLKQLNLEY